MTDHPTNGDRERLITDERTDALSRDEAAEVSLLVHVLGDSSTWTEPPPGLEAAVVQAITDAPAKSTPSHDAARRSQDLSPPRPC